MRTAALSAPPFSEHQIQRRIRQKTASMPPLLSSYWGVLMTGLDVVCRVDMSSPDSAFLLKVWFRLEIQAEDGDKEEEGHLAPCIRCMYSFLAPFET